MPNCVPNRPQVGVGYQHKTVVRQRTVEQPTGAGQRIVDMSVAAPGGDSKGKRRRRQEKKNGQEGDSDSSSDGSSSGSEDERRKKKKKKKSSSSRSSSKNKSKKEGAEKDGKRVTKREKKVRHQPGAICYETTRPSCIREHAACSTSDRHDFHQGRDSMHTSNAAENTSFPRRWNT